MTQKSSLARQHEFDIAYMKTAMAIGELSYALRKKVGAIVVSADDQIIAQGFNGTPAGLPNVCENVVCACDALHTSGEPYVCPKEGKSVDQVKSIKYCSGCKLSSLVTKPEVLHAETNAILKCARLSSSTKGGTLYVTLSPCINCAKTIIQAGIERVVYFEDYRDSAGIDLLKSVGIIVDKINL